MDLGRAEAVLPKKEQVKRENYRQGERIRGIVLDVSGDSKGPQVVMSRTHPGFIAKLFQMEVPEIYEGIVEIKTVAREPGERAKIAVDSNNPDVDPVGACVGLKGSRVQAVVQELKGEKIDIIHWSEDPAILAKNALSPAQISRVIVDEDEKSMEVVVPDEQLSLAIGRKGQNVRLAAKLTGWKIDIHTESEEKETRKEELSPEEALKKEVEAAMVREAEEALLNADIINLSGIGEKTNKALVEAGYKTVGEILKSSPEALREIEGIGEKKAEAIIKSAKEFAKRSEDCKGRG